MVAEKQAVIEQSIQLWRERTPQLNLNEMTNHVVKIQRQLRSTLRYQEEIRRIAARGAWKHLIQQSSPERVIRDANRPYRPRCADQQFAKRVMVLAQQVHLFSTVKHLTSAQHLETIFNDALYGRRALLASYLPFRPASLFQCDIADGDGNVICFGPSEIDPFAMKANTVELLFDLDKIAVNNPSIFFKQCDLGFALNKQRSVSINKSNPEPLFFSHTNSVPARLSRVGFANLSVYDDQSGKLKGVSTLANYALIRIAPETTSYS